MNTRFTATVEAVEAKFAVEITNEVGECFRHVFVTEDLGKATRLAMRVNREIERNPAWTPAAKYWDEMLPVFASPAYQSMVSICAGYTS